MRVSNLLSTGSPGAVAQVVEWAGSLIISSEIGSSSLSVSLARNLQGFDGGSEEKRSGSGPLHHSADSYMIWYVVSKKPSDPTVTPSGLRLRDKFGMLANDRA